jgi:hypothetical protein
LRVAGVRWHRGGLCWRKDGQNYARDFYRVCRERRRGRTNRFGTRWVLYQGDVQLSVWFRLYDAFEAARLHARGEG